MLRTFTGRQGHRPTDSSEEAQYELKIDLKLIEIEDKEGRYLKQWLF